MALPAFARWASAVAKPMADRTARQAYPTVLTPTVLANHDTMSRFLSRFLNQPRSPRLSRHHVVICVAIMVR